MKITAFLDHFHIGLNKYHFVANAPVCAGVQISGSVVTRALEVTAVIPFLTLGILLTLVHTHGCRHSTAQFTNRKIKY